MSITIIIMLTFVVILISLILIKISKEMKNANRNNGNDNILYDNIDDSMVIYDSEGIELTEWKEVVADNNTIKMSVTYDEVNDNEKKESNNLLNEQRGFVVKKKNKYTMYIKNMSINVAPSSTYSIQEVEGMILNKRKTESYVSVELKTYIGIIEVITDDFAKSMTIEELAKYKTINHSLLANKIFHSPPAIMLVQPPKLDDEVMITSLSKGNIGGHITASKVYTILTKPIKTKSGLKTYTIALSVVIPVNPDMIVTGSMLTVNKHYYICTNYYMIMNLGLCVMFFDTIYPHDYEVGMSMKAADVIPIKFFE